MTTKTYSLSGATRISCLCDRRRRNVTSLDGSSSRTAARDFWHNVDSSPAYCTASWWSRELRRRARKPGPSTARRSHKTTKQGVQRRQVLASGGSRYYSTLGRTFSKRPACSKGRHGGRNGPSDGNAVGIDDHIPHEPGIRTQLFHGLFNLGLPRSRHVSCSRRAPGAHGSRQD